MNWYEYGIVTGMTTGYWYDDCAMVKIPVAIKNSNMCHKLVFGKDKSSMLVAGLTGSGKSELKKFLLSNLVKRYSPKKVNIKGIQFGDSYDHFGQPLFLMPHTKSMTACSDGVEVLYALKKLFAEMEAVYAYTNSEKYVVNEHADIPHTFVFIEEIIGAARELEIEKDVYGLLHNILEIAPEVNYNIVIFEQGVAESFAKSEAFKHLDYKVCLRVTPETSRAVLGTDVACLIKEGTGNFYMYDDELVLYEFPIVPCSTFEDIVTAVRMIK